MLLFALQPVAIITNTFNTWHGNSLVPALMALSILILLYGLDERNRRISYSMMGISMVPLLLAYLLWSGGALVLAAYVFVLIAILLFRHTKNLKVTLISGIGLLIIGWLIFMRVGGAYLDGSVTASTWCSFSHRPAQPQLRKIFSIQCSISASSRSPCFTSYFLCVGSSSLSS